MNDGYRCTFTRHRGVRERADLMSSLDGLYRVTTSYLCAGFVIADGRVVMCAPILRRRLPYWRTIAKRVNK